MSATKPHRVVIVGAGFGGLAACKRLRHANCDITLIDKRNFHLFQPLLYQVATGSLATGDVTTPTRSIFRHSKNVSALMSEVTDFDLARQAVVTTDSRVHYDTLIIAAGSTTSYFGHDEWADIAVGLKTIEEAVEIRRRVFLAFEEAEKKCTSEERQELLTFAIIGAGPTGVELAGAISEIARDTLRDDYRCIRPDESRILLIDALDRVLSSYPPDLSSAAERALIELGVRFLPGTKVIDVAPDHIVMQGKNGSKQELRTRTIIWAAGVAANPLGRVLASKAGAPTTRGGQIVVNADCTVPGFPNIFVIGDIASYQHTPDQRPLPGVAPVAMQMGSYVADVIERRMAGKSVEPFKYKNRGSLATIGRNKGIADLGKLHFHGLLAWALWLFVHLMYLVQFKNRVIVFVQWAIQYLTFNRSSRLITGPAFPCNSADGTSTHSSDTTAAVPKTHHNTVVI